MHSIGALLVATAAVLWSLTALAQELPQAAVFDPYAEIEGTQPGSIESQGAGDPSSDALFGPDATDETATPGQGLFSRRIALVIKNGSSFKATLTVYDNICRRHLIFAKQYQAWAKETVKACAGAGGHADITVSRAFGSRKKRFGEVAENETIKF